MDHKEKNKHHRDKRNKSRRAHLRQLQKCYDNLLRHCRKLHDDNQQLRTDYYKLMRDINDKKL